MPTAMLSAAPTYLIIPRLNQLLKERRMTQLELQRLSGVPQASISRFDGNHRHEDSHLFAISRALGVNIEDLFYAVPADNLHGSQ